MEKVEILGMGIERQSEALLRAVNSFNTKHQPKCL
jgi:hypothetical protein